MYNFRGSVCKHRWPEVSVRTSGGRRGGKDDTQIYTKHTHTHHTLRVLCTARSETQPHNHSNSNPVFFRQRLLLKKDHFLKHFCFLNIYQPFLKQDLLSIFKVNLSLVYTTIFWDLMLNLRFIYYYFFKEVSTRLHLFDQKCNRNCNIVKSITI